MPELYVVPEIKPALDHAKQVPYPLLFFLALSIFNKVFKMKILATLNY